MGSGIVELLPGAARLRHDQPEECELFMIQTGAVTVALIRAEAEEVVRHLSAALASRPAASSRDRQKGRP